MSKLQALQTAIETAREIAGEDEDFLLDVLESETDFYEFSNRIASKILLNEEFAKGVANRISALQTRKARFQKDAEALRVLLANLLAQAGQHKVKTSAATISLRDVKPKVIVDEESDIPTQFWKPQPPKLDQSALNKCLQERLSQLAVVNSIQDQEERLAALAEVNKEFPEISGTSHTLPSKTISIRGA